MYFMHAAALSKSNAAALSKSTAAALSKYNAAASRHALLFLML